MARIDTIVTYAADKGFVYGPAPEIYGGLAGFYTYGPLGKRLKNHVEDRIRQVFQDHDFFEVECPTVMPRKIWEASGHLGGFTDPVVQCTQCNNNWRVDHLIEEHYPDTQTAGWKNADYADFLEQQEVPCPNCKNQLPSSTEAHTLMMKTVVGLGQEAYNRPETATTTYLPFPRYWRFFREKMPFGVFQIGKAYRNEISPRQFVVRMREFTQAEGQLFLFEDQKHAFDRFAHVALEQVPFWTEELQKTGKDPVYRDLKSALQGGLIGSQAYAYVLHVAYRLFLEMGIPADRVRLRQHHSDEKAFYATDAWDLEINTSSFGWIECCGIHDRGDYDLTQHSKHANADLRVQDHDHEKQLPHIIEIAFGADRPLFALLDLFYSSKEENNERDLFQVPKLLAPIPIAVFPLVNKVGEKAQEVYQQLKSDFFCQYDKGGSVGRRYARADEIGIPYCVTVDFETLNGEGVTVRDRDTTQQIRVPLEVLNDTLKDLFAGKKAFMDAGTPVQ